MIDIDLVRKLNPEDGAIFALPEGTDEQTVRDFAEALHLARPGVKCLVFLGDVRKLSVADMNAAGWYRA